MTDSTALTPVARKITGGRVWEFTHDETRYEIESLNGSSMVRLYRVTGGRTQVAYRKTQGRSARAVAEELHALTVSGGQSER